MESNEKDLKIKELTDKVEFLSSIIIKAHKYAKNDPEIALTQARKSAEAICRNIFSAEIGEPGKIMLDELIKKLAEKKLLPTKILLPLGTIQAYGNYGSHAQSAHENIDFNYITPCLSALAQVSSWYFTEYLKTNIPADLVAEEGTEAQEPKRESGETAPPDRPKPATPGVPGPKPVQPKKKSLLWVSLAVAVLAVAAGVFFLTRQESPEQSVSGSIPETTKVALPPLKVEVAKDSSVAGTVKQEEQSKAASGVVKEKEQPARGEARNAAKVPAQKPEVIVPAPAPATADVDPTVLKEAPPEYPPSMAGSHVEGDVRVRVFVDATGKPTEARILSYDDERFQQPAIAAAMLYKFSPGLAAGKPVPAWITVKIQFKAK